MNSKVNLGEEIKNTVQSALNNKDFQKLNRDVENIVRSALDEVRHSKQSKNRIQDKDTSINSKKVNIKTARKNELDLKSSKLAVPVGKVSGIIYTVFGTMTSIGFGIAIFVLAILGFTLGKVFSTVAIGLSPLFILSIVLLLNGNKTRKRLKRFHKYMAIIKGQTYYSIDDLSKATRSSHKFIVKDLEKMIELEMFPQGHIDDEKTWFMLNNETYRQYLKLQKNIKMIRVEKDQEFQESDLNKETSKSLSPEVKKTIDGGRRLVLEIKQANTAIPGDTITNKLDRLEEVTGKIFDHVEKHPEKCDEIKKFTEYFLPTTLKLLDGYKKLDYQSVQGENISNAKKEIERTMDTINLAFENLLDDLFQDMAMDISTDISVLETMLAQEGLTNTNMRDMNNKEAER